MKVLTLKQAKLNNSVVALGKFEGLHLGHKLLIDKVVSLADQKGFCAAVCTIDIQDKKHIYIDTERYKILRACGIDVVVSCPFTKEFAEMTPEEFVKDVLIDRLSARCVVVGSDFKFGYMRKGDIDTLKVFGIKYNIEILIVDKLSVDGEIVSSSLIRKQLALGNVQRANRLLGRNYSISGSVSKGRQLGRTIGFPTANLIPDKDKLLLRFGVYSTRVFLDGKTYMGLTNVGDNPTVKQDESVTVETYILDFDGDIYDNDITVEFIDFIRPEMKFSSVNELVLQMNIDKSKLK